MSERSPGQVLDDLAGILRDFHGREYTGPIGRDTWFFADVGLASIDAVVLGETLESFYGRKLPFGDFLGRLGARADRDMRLGELADFLSDHLSRG